MASLSFNILQIGFYYIELDLNLSFQSVHSGRVRELLKIANTSCNSYLVPESTPFNRFWREFSIAFTHGPAILISAIFAR